MSATVNNTILRPLLDSDRQRHDELMSDLDRAHHAALPNLIREPDDARIPEDEYRRRIADPMTFCAGAELERELVGVIRVSLMVRPGGRAHLPVRFARIEEIVVRPDLRRRGIGHALLNAARDWARENSAQSLDLNVYAFNTEAIAFYEREGFATKMIGFSMPLT